MAEGADDAPDAPEWCENHWLNHPAGWGLILLDIVLVIVVTAYLVRTAPDSLADDLLSFIRLSDGGGGSSASFEITRLNVVLFTVLGALGYVFTPIYKSLDRSVKEILKYNLRIPGAVPIGYGAFLLSDFLIQGGAFGTLALNFLAGLYVNIFYERFGAIADVLLPSEDEDTGGTDDGDTAETDGDDQDTDGTDSDKNSR